MKKTIVLGSLFFCILSTLSYSQSATETKSGDSHVLQKRPLTPKDYKLWSRLYGEKISDNGDWYSYHLWYGNRKDRKDTLVIGANKKDIDYRFPTMADGKFSNGSQWFGCLVPEKGLAMLDLEKDSLLWIPQIQSFEFSKNGQFLIGLRTPHNPNRKPSLLILDLYNGKEEYITGVTEYLLSQKSNKLAYITEGEIKKAVKLRIMEPFTRTTLIAENDRYNYKRLVWNDWGTALAFLQELPGETENPKGHKLYYYTNKPKRNKLRTLDSVLYSSQFSNKRLTDQFLKISEDGAAVFFRVWHGQDLNTSKNDSLTVDVQVWAARDKQLYPKRKRNKEYGVYTNRLAGWWPEKEKVIPLESDSLPVAILNRHGKHLLSYDPLAYVPQPSKDRGDIDLYLTDLETGERQLLLRQQAYGKYGSSLVRFSPGGKYITYFRDKHWWAFDLEKNVHINMTKGIGVRLHTIDYAFAQIDQPYGAPGWTQGDKELLVYDQYDVWLLSPKGKAPERLTRGRESQVSYRIYGGAYKDWNDYGNGWFPDFRMETFNPSGGLIFEMQGSDMASGYSFWEHGKQSRQLVYGDMKVNNLRKSKNREAHIYVEQSFDTPPRIRFWEKGMARPEILVQSNPQQNEFHWGRSELVHYPGPDGQPLKGALFYPANYRPGQKYPMIVHIYEHQSHKLYEYNNPSENEQTGFNRTNYTADGYMVFYPDIKYRFNDPGISAVECIEAGVKAVLDKGVVDKERIGLIGHSFGGYETAFIVTKTDIFATAVAGAGITDLVSWYHGVAWDRLSSQMFRFENHQHRFSDSFYENPAAYLRNSPIHHAANINIPLLLWTGGRDKRVDWHQSVELYLGLRRLDKECELLIYPEEAHAMYDKPQNQADLTQRIRRWFGKYLKPENHIEGKE